MAESQLAKLAKLSEADAVAMIEHTIAGGWQGLFAPKDSDQPPKPRQTHEELMGGRKGTRIKISELPENTEPFDPQDDDIPF